MRRNMVKFGDVVPDICLSRGHRQTTCRYTYSSQYFWLGILVIIIISTGVKDYHNNSYYYHNDNVMCRVFRQYQIVCMEDRQTEQVNVSAVCIFVVVKSHRQCAYVVEFVIVVAKTFTACWN